MIATELTIEAQHHRLYIDSSYGVYITMHNTGTITCTVIIMVICATVG